jgi:hypothetical protein
MKKPMRKWVASLVWNLSAVLTSSFLWGLYSAVFSIFAIDSMSLFSAALLVGFINAAAALLLLGTPYIAIIFAWPFIAKKFPFIEKTYLGLAFALVIVTVPTAIYVSFQKYPAPRENMSDFFHWFLIVLAAGSGGMYLPRRVLPALRIGTFKEKD